MCQGKIIKSIKELMEEVESDSEKWGLSQDDRFPWYRGEPNCNTPLIPKLYRKKYKGDYFENRLLQHFRIQAPSPEHGAVPDRSYVDQWLFLAQHVGLPTRLLDWTESSLVGLYFALQEEIPIVWMLNPFELNRLSTPNDKLKETYNIHAITWFTPPGGKVINIGSESINSAWEARSSQIKLPVAIRPTNIHTRMTAQKSCFTVHGEAKESLCVLLEGKDILKKYIIDDKNSKRMLKQLRQMGISRRTLFPDLDGLAKDLTTLFRPDLVSKTGECWNCKSGGIEVKEIICQKDKQQHSVRYSCEKWEPQTEESQQSNP